MKTHRLHLLLAFAGLVAYLSAAQAQPQMSSDIKALLQRCVSSPELRAKGPINDEVARYFKTTFKSQNTVYADAKVIGPLKISGCYRVALELTMPGATVMDTKGRAHPVKVDGQMNFCVDGSMPTEDQLR